MKVLFAASEVVPFAKVGGLADVAGSIPPALAPLGAEVEVIIPYYRQFVAKAVKTAPKKVAEVTVPDGKKRITVEIFSTFFPGTKLPVFLVDYPKFFDREQVYGYPDDMERFVLFSKAVYEFSHQGKYDLVHCNDWQTGLVPAYLKLRDKKPLPSLLTVHNLQYQGVFPADKLAVTGLPEDLLRPLGPLEFYGNLNLMKAGIYYSDIVTTVSPTYAKEIATPAYGEGMDGLLREKGGVKGILNGVDTSIWNPETDKLIAKTYGYADAAKREANKKALLEEFGLEAQKDTPLLGMISRLADQKGFDLILDKFPELMKLNLQLVLLGTGEPRYHEAFTKMQKKYAKKFGLKLAFDNRIAHLIEAGSDFFFMPSRFEPCGLNQMYSLRYGAVPVVRSTGGLADTIIDADENPIAGNGFAFREYEGDKLVDAVKRAVDFYQRQDAYRDLQVRAMTADVSWEASGRKYLKVYREALEKSKPKPEPVKA